MRILTVRQPWAWAIIYGGKDVENRVRNIAGSYRGPVTIHAAIGKTADINERQERLLLDHDVDGKLEAWMGGEPIEGGVILGVVDLVDVHKGHNTERDRFRAVRSCYQAGKPFGPCSVWAEPDAWHLELANPRPLADPIPYKGALGLRTLDESTAIRVWEAIA